jgi:hypothetical protein
LLLLLLLVFLIPVAAYCLILAMVNRRLHAVMVSGPWDAAGLLFAASGLLLFVGPVTITILFHPGLGVVAHLGPLLAAWWLVWLGYYVLVLGGAVLLLRLRRNKTVIYNVDPAEFDQLLAQLLDRLGLAWNRVGNRVAAVAARPAPKSARAAGPLLRQVTGDPIGVAAEEHGPVLERPPGEAVFDVEPFESLCHVTLHWRRQSGLVREKLEAELERALAELPAPDNPAGGWFMGVAGFLLALIFLGIFILVLNNFFPPRH